MMKLSAETRQTLGEWVEEAHDPLDGSGESTGRDFRLYAIGRIVSEIGDRIAVIVLVFVVIHLSKGSPLAVGLFYISRVLPTLAAGLLAGVLADRFDRRTLMVSADVGRALILLVVPTLGDLSLWTLYPLVIVLYALSLIFDTSARAALPDVVPESQMTRANGILQGIETGADLAYAVGGGLVVALGLRLPLYIDALTFLFSAALVWRMRFPRLLPTPEALAGSLVERTREGVAFLVSHPFLRWSTVAFTIAPLAGGAMYVVVPLYANTILSHSGGLVGPLRDGAFRFSVLEVCLGVGALAGSYLAIRQAGRSPRGRLVGIGLLGMGVVDLSFAVIGNIYIAAAVMALHGLFNSLFAVSVITLVQTLTPSEIRGRVVAVRNTVINGAIAVGSALGGAALGLVSYHAMWLLIGASIAVASLAIWLPRGVRSQV
jgi:MFS family permease